MGYLNRLLARSAKAVVDNVPAWLQATGAAERFSVPETWLPHAQLELYQRLSWVHIAVSMVAQTAAIAALNVKQLEGEEAVDIPNHPFEQLLRRPNPLMSRFEFLEATFSHVGLTGNGYWWLNRTRPDVPPSELWVIPSYRLRPVPDGRLYLRGYLYDPGDGTEIPLEPWEIVHFRRFHPLNNYVGLSSVEPLATVATGDMAMQQWNTNFFDKDNAKAPGALAFADPIGDSDWKKLKADVKEEQGGVRRNLMMLRNVGKGGVEWVSMAMTQKDMEFLEARRFNKEEIFAVFAPGLSSMIDVNATEANSVTGKKTFTELAVWPRMVSIAEKISNDLLPAYGPNLTAEFDDIRETDRQLELQEQEAFARVHTVDETRKQYYGDDGLGDERGSLLVEEVTKAGATPSGTAQMAAAPVDDIQPTTVAESTVAAQEPAKAALKAAALKAQTGVMVAFFMPPDVRAELVGMQGALPINSAPTPANELHLTMAYLGDSTELGIDDRMALEEAVVNFASTMPPVVGQLSGLGRFNSVEDTGAQAVYVSFDSYQIQRWREDLLAALAEQGLSSPSVHGFTPHITLGYVPAEASTPVISVPPIDVRFDAVTLAWAGDYRAYPLQDPVAVKAAEIETFKRWCKRREQPDPGQFESAVLSDVEKLAILQEHFPAKAPTKVMTLQLDPDDGEAEQQERMNLERKIQAEIEQALQAQLDVVIPAGMTVEQAAGAVGRVEETAGIVRDALRKALVESSDLGVRISVRQLERVGLRFDWTLANTAARDWANQYAGELITRVNETTKKQVGQAVGQWIENGDPLRSLIDELEPTFGLTRATLIASNEVTVAIAEGNVQGWKASGLATKDPEKRPVRDSHIGCRCWLVLQERDGKWVYVWRTSQDEAVCPICGPLANVAVGETGA
jgi:HK97 family phage portal protein